MLKQKHLISLRRHSPILELSKHSPLSKKNLLIIKQKTKKVFELGIENAFYYGMFAFFLMFVMFGSLDALVWFAAYLNKDDGLSVGEFTSFQFYMFSFIMNF